MDPNTRALIMGAAGGAADKTYVEDVFSTWLYAGNNSTQTISNGIDLSGKGGLVWIKNRTTANAHHLFDTTRGATKILKTNSTGPQSTDAATLTGFSSSGFTLSDSTQVNGTSNYVSWTFREAPKFFDVVSWTGDGASSRTISHSLGSTPGFIIIKSVDYPGVDWQCWHRSISTGTLSGNNLLKLNLTDAANSVSSTIGSVSSTTFEIGSDSSVNQNFYSYVAYVFAHDAGGFGDSGNDSIINCGSYTGNGATGGQLINLGWEAQWVLVKSSNSSGDWWLVDAMRGWAVNGDFGAEPGLTANASSAESNQYLGNPDALGFRATENNINANSTNYIYIAIRRGPMKTPTDATKVYENVAYTGDQTSERVIGTSALVDFFLLSDRDATSTSWTSYAHYIFDRLRGRTVSLATALTNAESTGWGGYVDFDRQTGWDTSSSGGGGYLNKTSTKYVSHNFRRAPGFFDVVAYTGTGANQQVTHNLGVVPEMMFIKSRSGAFGWAVYHSGMGTDLIELQSNSFSSSANPNWWDNGAPTSTLIKTPSNSNAAANRSGDNFIAYLFASCLGVSKIGSYTGTATTLSIDCGFTNGARFVLIRRKDAGGDWYVWDTARGIIANNDPYLLLNSTAAEVTNTDYIDPLSSGFQISSTAPAAINANGGSYIYLAIA